VPFFDRVDDRMSNTEDPENVLYNERTSHMKRLMTFAVLAVASQAAAIFAGEPMVSSKQVIAPFRTLRV